MQDRPDINVDPTLVDRGWEQMLHQLDEVMPVRKKRFFPWFLLLLFLVVGSSAGIYKTFQVEQHSTEEQIELPSKSSVNLIENTPIAEVQTTNSSQQKNEVVASPNIETESINSQPIQTNSIQTIKDEHNIYEFVNSVTTSNAVQSNSDATVVENTIIEEIELPAPMPLTEEKDIIVREAKKVALLAQNDIKLLENPIAILDKKVSFISPKSIRFFAITATEVGFSGDPQGLSFGIGAQKSLNQKLSIELGANYQLVSAKLVSDALGLSNKDSEGFFAPLENIYGGQTYSLNQTYNHLELQRLNVPLQLRYKVANRWHLTTGIQTTYYTKAVVKFDPAPASAISAPEEDIVNNRLDLYVDELSVFSLDTRTNIASLPYNLKPNHWQWSGLMGVQYQVSNHFEVEAGYRKNLTNWPDSKDNFGAKSFISLGLRYYLGK